MKLGVSIVALLCLSACSSGNAEPPSGDEGGGGAGGAGGAVVGQGGAGGSAPDACDLQADRLQQALESTHSESMIFGGAAMAVISPSCGKWEGATGMANETEAMTPAYLMRIGSVTKTYVSATVLTLAADGMLSLDDPLDTWVSGVPDGDVITISMLLNHTSGIYSFTDDSAFIQEAASDPTQSYTPQQVVDVALTHSPVFAPGTSWSYSNTNYILLGMIIEAVTGSSLASAMRTRVLDPVGLDDTYLDGDDVVPDAMARGYGAWGGDSTTIIHPSVTWAAGSMVATVGDVADWASALYGGSILADTELDLMLEMVDIGAPGLQYGLGVFEYGESFLGADGIGHGGDISGYHAEMVYLTPDGTMIAAATNSNFSGFSVAYLEAALGALE